MPIRNPFARRTEVQSGLQPYEQGIRPLSQNDTRPGFEKVDTMGSKASTLSIASKKSQEPPEYKMSVVNDSGVYLPPSPPEKKSFWPKKSNPSGTSTSTRTSESFDNEPFTISRESFDSYRRSFDVSAKSQIVSYDNGRQSLDSARIPRLPRSAMNERRFERQPLTAEEGFEDVGLNDEKERQVKKKGFFSRLGEGDEGKSTAPITSRFHIPGRKRGQSGVGEELGSLQTSEAAGNKDVKES